MYRSASPPLFGIPDYPPLRRVKPLPKRRRTSRTSFDINPHTSVNLKTSSVLSNASTKTYIDSMYSSSSHVSSHHLSQPQPYHIPGSSGPSQSVQDSEFDWEPFLGLPEEALRVAYDLPMRGSLDINDERNGAMGDPHNEKQLLLPEHDLPPLMGSDSLPIAVTPPPSSDASTDEDSDSQARNEALNRLSLIPNHPPLTPEDSNGEEDPESEGTEGDLQERLFSSADTDRFLAQTDPLSTKMALHDYYHSMGLGLSEFDTNTDVARLGDVATGYTPPLPDTTMPLEGDLSRSNLTAAGGYVAVGVGRSQDEEITDGRGEYIDHSSQQSQGNTKKRKVPANVGNSPPHHHIHHYSSYRGVQGAYGTGTAGYGEVEKIEVDEEEREYNFGFGFGMDLGAGNLAVSGSDRDVESDVFGPLSGPAGGYQNFSSDDAVLPPRHFHRKAKLSPATQAGLQRKELIRRRKKQLEAIMGPLSTGNNSWTLDHALSMNFPSFLSISSASSSPSDSPTTDSDPGVPFRTNTYLDGEGGKGDGDDERLGMGWGRGEDQRKEVKVRLSKRENMRVARVVALGLGRLGRHPDAAPFPAREFTFAVSSTISDRLVAIQEEVASLRNLFGTELARQTARVAKSNKNTPGKTGKKRAQQRARTIKSAKSGEQPAEFLEMPQRSGDASSRQQVQQQQSAVATQNVSQTSAPKKGKKKKKRSTLANASNPHHLRNYVPSRLPHAAGGGGSTGGNHGPSNQAMNTSTLWPSALKFLSAELPPRRRKSASGGGQNGVQPLPQLVFPQEEWVCMFCEYKLFYGDDSKYRLAVRNRKKILRRRRRARERAAAAASGVNAAMKNAPAPSPTAEDTQVEDEEYDGPGYESVPSTTVNAHVDGIGRTRIREPGG